MYKNINRWSSDMKDIWNVKIVIYYKYTNYKWKKTGTKNHIFWFEIGSGFENRAAHPLKIPRGTTPAPLPAETGNKEENF